MKKIIAAILFIVSLFVCVGCAGSPIAESQTLFDDNDIWECRYLLKTYKDGSWTLNYNECMLGDWTYAYKQEHEYLPYVFFPSHINGNILVTQLGYTSGMGTNYYYGYGKWFIPYGVKDIIRPRGLQHMVSGRNLNRLGGSFYIPEKYEEFYREKFSLEENVLHLANVVFDINYENEEYEYHSVDNYDYSTEEKSSLIEIIPPDPVRYGFVFDGWFKEPECINKWDFAADSLPMLKTDENGKVIHQETALYAKWITE